MDRPRERTVPVIAVTVNRAEAHSNRVVTTRFKVRPSAPTPYARISAENFRTVTHTPTPLGGRGRGVGGGPPTTASGTERCLCLGCPSVLAGTYLFLSSYSSYLSLHMSLGRNVLGHPGQLGQT